MFQDLKSPNLCPLSAAPGASAQDASLWLCVNIVNTVNTYLGVVSCYMIAAQKYCFSTHKMVRPILCFLFLMS